MFKYSVFFLLILQRSFENNGRNFQKNFISILQMNETNHSKLIIKILLYLQSKKKKKKWQFNPNHHKKRNFPPRNHIHEFLEIPSQNKDVAFSSLAKHLLVSKNVSKVSCMSSGEDFRRKGA